jgi:hypothetical protein
MSINHWDSPSLWYVPTHDSTHSSTIDDSSAPMASIDNLQHSDQHKLGHIVSSLLITLTTTHTHAEKT